MEQPFVKYFAEQFTSQNAFAMTICATIFSRTVRFAKVRSDNSTFGSTYNGRVGLHAIRRALEACYESMMHSRNAISLSCNQLYNNLFI